MNKPHSKWQNYTLKEEKNATEKEKKRSNPCTLNIVVIKNDYYWIGAVMQPQMHTLCFCLTNESSREGEIDRAGESNEYSWNHRLESHFDWYRYFVRFVSRVVLCRVVSRVCVCEYAFCVNVFLLFILLCSFVDHSWCLMVFDHGKSFPLLHIHNNTQTHKTRTDLTAS